METLAVEGPWARPRPADQLGPTSAAARSLVSLLQGDTDPSIRPVRWTMRATRNIYLSGQKLDGLTVLLDGWAFRYCQLPDGRRQILSVLLPGDVLAAGALVRPTLDVSIQALTPVSLCRFESQWVRQRIAAEPTLFETIALLFESERERADQSLTDIGQRPAHERMARFFLQLRARLQDRNLSDGDSFACPLRQRHIADAMGLTTVHVNRVMGQFRNAGALDFHRGVVKIFDEAELKAIANLK